MSYSYFGFNGKSIPPWLREFERRFGLGGVILFDYDCKSKKYENNIYSPGQVTELCLEISNLLSRPLLFVDREGGKVRRLKDGLAFAPLPSQEDLARLGESKRGEILFRSFRERG